MTIRKLIAGNWKMNGAAADLEQVRRLAEALRREPAAARVVVCPPATLLHRTAELAGEGPIEVGAQDAHHEGPGARTGDLAAAMLHDAGARWVILGHSERRTDHREDDALVAAKVRAALDAGLHPIICVGETLAERRVGRAEIVVRGQVAESLPPELEGRDFALAYEPVWAIGTGETPTVDEVSAMHGAIRAALKDAVGAIDLPLLYGGSVKPSNAAELLHAEGVDGALVGGASLKAEEFLAIVRAAGLSRRTGEPSGRVLHAPAQTPRDLRALQTPTAPVPMIFGILLAFVILVCIALAGVVLLQRSEGGALGMGGGPSGFLTTRGAGDLLTRITWILGSTLFALCLGMTILQGRLNKGTSVIDRVKIDPASVPTSTMPAQPTPAAAGQPPAPPATDGFGAPAPTVNVGPTTAPAAAPGSVAPGAVTSTAKPAKAAKAPAAVTAPAPTVTAAPAKGASAAQTPPDTNTGPTDAVAKTVGGLPNTTAPAPRTN